VFAFGQEIAVRSSANATLRGAWLPPGFRLPVSPEALGLGLGALGLAGLLVLLARLGAYGPIARHPAASATSLALVVTLVPLPAWAGGAPQFGNGGNTWVPRWIVNDHLGNAVLFVTAAGSEVKRRVFGPYGAVIAEGATTEPTARQFTGQRFEDAMGLYDFKARWYDPETGRFLSIDPLVQDVFDPQVANPYGYVRNNPLNLVDPTGMFSFSIDIGGISIAVAIGYGGPAFAGGSGGGAGFGLVNPPPKVLKAAYMPLLRKGDTFYSAAGLIALGRMMEQAWGTILRALQSSTSMTLDIGPGIGLGGNGSGRTRGESQSEASVGTLPWPVIVGLGDGPWPGPLDLIAWGIWIWWVTNSGDLTGDRTIERPARRDPFVVRLQAQGGGVEESVLIARQRPVTATEALAGLEGLRGKLSPAEQRQRAPLIRKAQQFIGQAAAAGGVPANTRRSFALPGSSVRIDVEVLSGSPNIVP
jgi:RHS repeat-associated protein